MPPGYDGPGHPRVAGDCQTPSLRSWRVRLRRDRSRRLPRRRGGGLDLRPAALGATETDRPREVADWLDRLGPEQREQAQWLAGRVHAAGPGIAEAVRWRRLTFTVHDDWHHWLSAVAVTKPAVSLVFHKGALLADPAGLLEGDARYVRRVRFECAAAHPEAVTALVREAIAHQTDLLP
ncbi:MAG: hypothetical protein GEV12_11245 [Micromonosporaceae bacterium]|nr:hypothetical protein [Micromonosporaceae bacterium]